MTEATAKTTQVAAWTVEDHLGIFRYVLTAPEGDLVRTLALTEVLPDESGRTDGD